MKNLLLILFLLMVIIIQGQQSKGIIDSKSPNELKAFKFELEYTPLSDIQPILLLKTGNLSYVGIKLISSSFIFDQYLDLINVFQRNPYWGFQTSLFVQISSNNLFIPSYIGQSDILSIVYRRYSKSKKNHYELGGYISTGSVKRRNHFMGNFGTEISAFHKYKSIWLGSSLQMGPIINLSEDRFFYGGFGICLNYFIVKFNLY